MKKSHSKRLQLRWSCLSHTRARVAELADALASGASDRKVVEVRVLSRAPNSHVSNSADIGIELHQPAHWITGDDVSQTCESVRANLLPSSKALRLASNKATLLVFV